MATHTKMTPFARLLLVIVIVAPLAYLGASYYNGEDPLKNITDTFSGGTDKIEHVDSELGSMSKEDLINKIDLLEIRISQLEQKIENLESSK